MRCFHRVLPVFFVLIFFCDVVRSQRYRDRDRNRPIIIDARPEESPIQKERRERLKKFMEERAPQAKDKRQTRRNEFDEPESKTSKEVDYYKLYNDHIMNRYGLRNGRPAYLNLQVTGKVYGLADTETVLVSDVVVRNIDKAQTRSVNGTVRESSDGKINVPGV
ncbi:MAG: hypothetical protein AAF492_30720, partial [Verrucomicrobiota bacterium]